ncbi:MAG TPA: DUF3786 domain-containing protein [Methylomusa anaerophila]|uniref:DUF3786 domain-containing protein n=1 Tax=Methylomusa anaerophila TaxID=1930071 RepID=A0A348AFJ8_9FIRM|nr:DUF3786 domain-containing protein [Methylomusa anaerophila]BBB89846.1 hypothetical protein MAMMFC1_00480 [Methylomusa anaerophila]HML89108.1 DUF3786 domain-containing protein [Methylomusa anaerophila]
MQTGDTTALNLQKGYQLAYEKACAEFATRIDAEEIARNSGTRFDYGRSTFTIQYLNDVYTVSYLQGKVSYADREDEVPIAAKVVIMHYLLTAGGQSLTNKLISFKEIPGGMIYLQPFSGRVLGGFKAAFGKNSHLLAQAGQKVGGRAAKFGDAAVTLDILPNLPITYVIWEGDEELPANATALFDSTAQYYLPTEDLVVAAAAGASLLNKTAKVLK